jgi:hypothetical protein
MTGANRTPTLLAACLAALSLAACGGDSDRDSTGSAPVQEPKSATVHESTAPADAGTGTQSRRGPNGDTGAKTHAKRVHRDGDPATPPVERSESRTPASSQPTEDSDCPGQLSQSQCEQVAATVAKGKKRSPQPVQSGKCPSNLSQGECAEIVESSDGASSGRQPPLAECPPGLSEAQCKELEAAVSR